MLSTPASVLPAGPATCTRWAVQPDARILVGGFFTTLGNGGTTTKRYVVQPDGRILVAGDFTTLGGGGSGTVARNRIGRLNPDGSVDPTFNPGANGTIESIVLQADEGVLVPGTFTWYFCTMPPN